jgi:hypothetical protein
MQVDNSSREGSNATGGNAVQNPKKRKAEAMSSHAEAMSSQAEAMSSQAEAMSSQGRVVVKLENVWFTGKSSYRWDYKGQQTC